MQKIQAVKPKISTMRTSSKKPSVQPIKTKPTVFPLGFAIGQVESDVIVIDFIDEFNGAQTIIESIALPMNKAAELANALAQATKNGKTES
jgi:hypothetical protein